MTEEKSICDSKQESWLESWVLVRFKDGFFLGFVIALALQLGVINITTLEQKTIVGIFLLIGILISVNQAIRRKSLISPAWDGLISGFCTCIGIIDLIFPQLSILTS
jgi:hypothetical protein